MQKGNYNVIDLVFKHVSIGRNSDYDHCIHSSCKWTPGNDAYESIKDHTHP